MSTILKALQSLEAQDSEGRGEEGPMPSAKARGRYPGPGRLFPGLRVLAGIGLLCLLAGGGTLLIYLMSGESPEKRAGLHPSDTGERESREGRSPGFAQSEMPRRASVSDTGAAGGQVAQHGKERRQKVQAVVKRAKEKPVSVNRENRMRKNLPSPPPSQGGQQGEFAGKNTRNGSTVSEHRGLPELAEPDLILQAISWDRDPGRRIAVINSRLCREGDVLGEYTVLTINPDDVSLVRGDTRGRLVFPGK